MKATIFYDSIIGAIEKLYLKFAITVLHKRMDGYHKQLSQTTETNASGIKSPLLECLDEIIDVCKKKPHANSSMDYSLLSTHISNQYKHVEPHAIKRHIIDRENIRELSRYFKERSNGSELHPAIEERLEHSTWEHVHEAIRYARNSDNRNAKMHADIACNACMELAHYMVEEHYLAFVIKIEEHLNSLNSANH